MARFAWALSLLVGFLSLSQEILWVRLVSFALQGSSYAFPTVLVLFLIGVAQGAAIGKRWCESDGDLLRRSSKVLAMAAALDASVVLVVPALAGVGLALPAMLALVVVSAALKATIFPVAHHLGSDSAGPRLGRSVSKVYFANIIGCTLGPIVTGYVLLDLAPIEACLAGVALGTAALSTACAHSACRTGSAAPLRWSAASGVMAVAALVLPAHALIRSLTGEEDIEQVLQNRHGIIHTVGGSAAGARVYGGNAYDGVMSLDLQTNSNGLDRALVLLAVHPQPARVLVIGMSAGAWTRILSASPSVRELVVLEINPAYVELARTSPAIAPLLTDSRVTIHIDDGRRWLRRHPHERFDLVVQNTTFHWRAYSNNLLSREYLQLVRSHLNPGGIMAFNSTYSADVLRTAEAVFEHVSRRQGFVYSSDRPLDFLRADAEAKLRTLALEGRPVLSESAFHGTGLVVGLLAAPFVPHEQRYAGLNFRPSVITDGNLLTEQAHGNAFLAERLEGAFAWIDRIRTVTAPASTVP